jgi:hypothetical protein
MCDNPFSEFEKWGGKSWFTPSDKETVKETNGDNTRSNPKLANPKPSRN